MAAGSPSSTNKMLGDIIFWNCANGIVAKIDFIKHYLLSMKPELMFVTEAEIKRDLSYKCLDVSGYNILFSKTLSFGKC